MKFVIALLAIAFVAALAAPPTISEDYSAQIEIVEGRNGSGLKIVGDIAVDFTNKRSVCHFFYKLKNIIPLY